MGVLCEIIRNNARHTEVELLTEEGDKPVIRIVRFLPFPDHQRTVAPLSLDQIAVIEELPECGDNLEIAWSSHSWVGCECRAGEPCDHRAMRPCECRITLLDSGMERAREFLEGLTHDMWQYEERLDQWQRRRERERAADQARREWMEQRGQLVHGSVTASKRKHRFFVFARRQADLDHAQD